MTERQSKLIKLVNLYQKIEVSRLAELLDVSQVTILLVLYLQNSLRS